jgi:hypothetical protein
MLRYVLKYKSSPPLQFLFPVQPKQPAAVDSKEDIEQPAPAAQRSLTIAPALAAFVSTNVSNLFSLTLWFLKRTSFNVVLLGQAAGFTALLLVSVLGCPGAMALPQRYIHRLGRRDDNAG